MSGKSAIRVLNALADSLEVDVSEEINLLKRNDKILTILSKLLKVNYSRWGKFHIGFADNIDITNDEMKLLETWLNEKR